MSEPLLENGFEYHIAISYASENGVMARELADYLKGRGLKVFFADFEPEKLLGEDLQITFQKIFRLVSERAAVIISKNYCEKIWPQVEFAAVRAAILERQLNYLIPIRLDSTELPGLLSQIGYANALNQTPAQIGATICKKFWPALDFQKAYEIASLVSPENHTTTSFDYTDYRGRYRIGLDNLSFETYWTYASNFSVHCYANQTDTITSISILPIGKKLSEITQAASLPARNTSECPKLGQTVILRNDHGFYAAIKIVAIKSIDYGYESNELTIKYHILENGSGDFSRVVNF